MTECPEVVGDPDSIEPAETGRMAPGEDLWHHHDLSSLQCSGSGATILGVIASIHPDSDDGLLTLGTTIVDTDALGWSQKLTADPTETQRIYTIVYTVTTTDVQTLKRSATVPVLPTVNRWAA